MNKNILIFGSIAGAIVSVIMVISMLSLQSNPQSFDKGEVIGYASMLLAFSMIFVGIKNYRDHYNSGFISFKTAFLLGLGISVLASIIYTLTWVVFYKGFYPNFIDDYATCLLADAKTVAEVDKVKADIQMVKNIYSSWFGLIGMTFLEIFPVGLIVSLISALILKRKPKLAS